MSEPNEFAQYREEQEAKKKADQGPSIELGHPEAKYSVSFYDWKRSARVVLEDHFIKMKDLVHDHSLNCARTGENSRHPLCVLQHRLENMLLAIAPAGKKYHFPKWNRLEFGDERHPDSPLTKQEGDTYHMIKDTLTMYEKELALFIKAGAKTSASADASESKAPTLSFAEQSMQRARRPEPLNQSLVASETQRQMRTEQERPADEIRGSLNQEGIATRESEQEPIRLGTNPLENPRQYVQEAMELYLRSELSEWAPSANMAEHIERMSPKNRELVERYQREGWMPMYMPSRTVQMETLAKAIQKLKPIWIKNRARQTLNATYVWDFIVKLVEDKHPDLFKDVPDQPHFDLTRPSPNVLPNTTNKTVKEQKAEFARKKKIDPNLSVMSIPGFLAMETWATQTEFSVAQATGEPPSELSPIDDVNNSYTRFIDLPVSDGGFVPSGYFGPHAGSRQVRLGGHVAGSQCPRGGFRLSVRVPIV